MPDWVDWSVSWRTPRTTKAATSGSKEPQTPTDAVDNESSRVQAVVAYFPNSDLTNYGGQGRLISDHFRDHGKIAMEAVFNFRKWDPTVGGFRTMLPREKQEVLRDLSPISHVKADCPPTLLVGTVTRTSWSPFSNRVTLLACLNNVGVECDLFVAEVKDIRGLPHSMAKQKHSLDGSFSTCRSVAEHLDAGSTVVWIQPLSHLVLGSETCIGCIARQLEGFQRIRIGLSRPETPMRRSPLANARSAGPTSWS